MFSLLLWFSVMPLLVLSPAIGFTLFGPNWNGAYRQDDSLAQIIKDTMPLATGIFTVIFSISGKLNTQTHFILTNIYPNLPFTYLISI